MKTICIAFLCTLSLTTFGQTVSNQTLSSGGGFYEGASHNHSWTMGQFESTTLQSASHIATQGFQQPEGVSLSIKIDIKALLGGPYDSGTGLMADDLRTAGYIPLEEPYSGIYTHYPPGGGETTDAGVLSVTGNDAIIDWVFIELRDQNDSTVVLATRSALVQADGDVVEVDGVSPVGFSGVEASDYFVAVRHQNHLGVMTATAISLSDAAVLIDFTNPATVTYGIEAQEEVSGKTVMWAGEVVIDGVIKYSGLDNDRDEILQKIGGVIPTNTELGYNTEDVNRDGVVKYSGLDNDRDVILQNIGGVVPTNTIQEQLPE